MADLEVIGIGCSLGAEDAERRVGDWRRLVSAARRSERDENTFRAEFDPSAGLIAEVVRLCEAEIACCPFFTFTVEMAAHAIVVTVHGPGRTEHKRLFGRCR